jgi:DNA-binding response OmpR family regulator
MKNKKKIHLLLNALHGTPITKALSISIIETRLEMINNLDDRIEELEKLARRSEPTEPIIVGALVYDIDGKITFKGKPIKMRPQMRDLCVLFMKNHRNLVDYSKIKDELIDARKRATTGFTTITKYADELHKLLKKHFKKEVIFNYEREGYIFDIESKVRKLNKK